MAKLSAAQHLSRIADHRVLEQDGLGPKVLLLGDGTMAKLFRRRPGISSDKLRPYSLRFIANARHLKRRGIATLSPIERYQVPEKNLDVVLYQPLSGTSLKDICLKQAEHLDQKMAEELGKFIAELHQKGIFFRSLHLGNILYLDNGGFGLIDIADMKFQRWPLTQWQRLRNFKHLTRMKEGREAIKTQLNSLLSGYSTSHLATKFSRELQKILSQW